MIDWTLISGFEWDGGNVRKNADKHGVSQAEAEQVFFNRPLLVLDDVLHSRDESRFHALGRTNVERHLHLSFTVRKQGTLLRVISARDMNRKERSVYAQAS